MTDKTKRGGPNRHQGRKPLSDNERTVTWCAKVTESQRDKVKRIGGGHGCDARLMRRKSELGTRHGANPVQRCATRWHSVAHNGTVIFTSTHHGKPCAPWHCWRLRLSAKVLYGAQKGTRTALQMLEKLAAWCNFGAAISAEVKKSREATCSQPSAFHRTFRQSPAALRR